MADKRNQFAELLRKPNKPTSGWGKHIGGYYDPAIERQLKAVAVEEDTTTQELVAEALDLLFESRGKAAIARQV